MVWGGAIMNTSRKNVHRISPTLFADTSLLAALAQARPCVKEGPNPIGRHGTCRPAFEFSGFTSQARLLGWSFAVLTFREAPKILPSPRHIALFQRPEGSPQPHIKQYGGGLKSGREACILMLP